MRIEHHGLGIQIHPTRGGFIWVVYDDEGEQVGCGSARDEARAIAQARRTVRMIAGPRWLAPLKNWGRTT